MDRSRVPIGTSFNWYSGTTLKAGEADYVRLGVEILRNAIDSDKSKQIQAKVTLDALLFST